MKTDLSLDAIRAERVQRSPSAPGRAAAGWAGKLVATLLGAVLTMVASGFVAGTLWLAWLLAEVLS